MFPRICSVSGRLGLRFFPMLGWNFLRWFLRSWDPENVLLQTRQENLILVDPLSLCLRWWSVSCDFVTKCFRQTEHSCGRWPVWTDWWAWSWRTRSISGDDPRSTLWSLKGYRPNQRKLTNRLSRLSLLFCSVNPYPPFLLFFFLCV